MTSAGTSEGSRTAVVARARRLTAGRVAAGLPDLVVVGVAAYAVVCVSAVLLEQFRPLPVLSLGLVAAVAAMAVLGLGRPGRALDGGDEGSSVTPPGRHDVLAMLVLLVAVVGWVYVAMRLSGEFLFVWRDPGAYLNAGRWLVDHPGLAIDPQVEIFGGNADGIDITSLGFGNADGMVQAQGYHLLPALLATGAWVVGDPAFVLDVNAVVGGLALVAAYGLARRVAGPWWGLLLPAALAVSMPFVAFTRDPYTEPLALLLLLGSMSLLWRAVESRRTTDFVLAGLAAGAGCLVRVDAYLTMLAFLAALVLVVAVAARDERGLATRNALLAAVTAAVPVGLGVLDASQLSTPYWNDMQGDVVRLAAAAAAIVVLSPAVVTVAWREPVRAWALRRRGTLGVVAGAGLVAVVAVMASRPLWWVSHQNNATGFESLRAFQRSLGLPEEPTRSYEELTITWLSWYHGWPAVALGAVGLGLLLHRLVSRGDVRVAYVLAGVLGSGLLYLNQASIFPDQIWAMRRLLPVVVPGLLLGCAYLCAVAWARRGVFRLGAVVAAGLVVGITAYSLLPMLRVPSFRPQLTEITAVCEALPDDAALLAVDDAGQARGGFQQSLRGFCGVPVVGLEAPDETRLGEVAAAVEASGRTLYVVSFVSEDVPWEGSAPDEPWLTAQVVKWPERLLEPPAAANLHTRALYLGVVGTDGSVEPVPPPLDPTLDPDSEPDDVLGGAAR